MRVTNTTKSTPDRRSAKLAQFPINIPILLKQIISQGERCYFYGDRILCGDCLSCHTVDMSHTFTYTDFSVSDNRTTVNFNYQLQHNSDTYDFSEQLDFGIALPNSGAIHKALRSLHLALGISYYKIFVSEHITHPYAMTQDEADFWNNVWRSGLGEFLYVNKLSPDSLAQFTPQPGQEFESSEPYEGSGALLGIGGGKDSIVGGELLKAIDLPVEGFVMATGSQLGQTQDVAKVMEIPLHAVKRTLDPQLLEVQEQSGAYKGHVPISLIFGLVGTVLAIAKQNAYVVVANESSASIPRISWEHGDVNHQWSKSLELERALQNHIHTNIAGVTYFSAVRQLSSVAITKIFAGYPEYFEVFTSDNSVFRINPKQRPTTRWSLESPKGLSSYILLAPWLSEEELFRTFGRDFLNESSLEQLFLEMTGVSGEPPLDCVGTVDELVLSLTIAYWQDKCHDSALMSTALEKGIISSDEYAAALQAMLALQPAHAIPEQLAAPLQERIGLVV